MSSHVSDVFLDLRPEEVYNHFFRVICRNACDGHVEILPLLALCDLFSVPAGNRRIFPENRGN